MTFVPQRLNSLHKRFSARFMATFNTPCGGDLDQEKDILAQHGVLMDNRTVQRYFLEAFSQMNRTGALPDIEVVFYPYAGLNNTIRVRQRRVYVRISDVLSDAPLPVIRAIAFILVSKLFRRRVHKSWDSLYRSYTTSPRVVKSAEQSRRRRGRKMVSGPVGAFYDLETTFARLNSYYFDSRLEQPTLSWSQRCTYRIFGHHDPVHNTIVVSRTLDAENVPQYVLEYIMYHEMLHMVHRPKITNGRWYYHTPEFKYDEKQFAYYDDATTWFEELRVKRSRPGRKNRSTKKTSVDSYRKKPAAKRRK